MKVLVVHNAYQSHHIGGEDVVVKQEIAALKQALGEENIFEYSVSNDDIRPLDLVTKLWGNHYHFKQIAQLVKNNAIDIVHVHNFFPLLTPSVFAGAKYAGAKVFHTLHNFRWWCSSGLLYRNNKECEKCLGKSVGWAGIVHKCYRNSYIQSAAATMAFAWYRLKDYTKHIDAYFVLTRFSQQKLQNILPTKMLLKPNGILMPKVSPFAQKKDYLFVGRLETAKGIELLLSTWKKLPTNFYLNVVGTGEQEQTLRKAYNLDNIRFWGKLEHDKVMELMAQAKFFIHSSLSYETFGLTLLEALSVGTPVIALDIGPRGEFIQSGKNGFLCHEQNFMQTILSTWDIENYDTLSQQASESAKPFYIDNVMAKQISYYDQVLQGDIA